MRPVLLSRRLKTALAVSILVVAVPVAAQPPAVCAGSSSLGTVRILVRHSAVGLALPIKSVSSLPVGAHLIWDPVHLPRKQVETAEVTAILAPPSGEDLVVLKPLKAGVPEEWRLAIRPAAIALVFGPQGLSAGKVKSLVTHNQQLVEQLADYAEQTSKVESLVQELSNAEQSGSGVNAALKGFSARYGVALPKLGSQTSTDQQAALLLKTVLPTANTYDPLAAGNTQTQQSAGLAASVAGLFFGNAVGLAAGGTALVQGIKGAFFFDAEFRSAFAQSGDKDGLMLCAKASALKARTRIAYLWAYRVPNLDLPVVSVTGPTHLPVGLASTIKLTATKGAVKQLEKARDWHLVAQAGGASIPVVFHLAHEPDSIEIDLTHAKLQPGDYHLAASWDWDPLEIAGTLHLHPLADFSHAQLAAESREKLIEGSGTVSAKLTGADFEFLEKASVAKAATRPPKPAEAHFVLPLGSRAGMQNTVAVELDTAARGAFVLSLTQSGGHSHEIPFTVLPPNPAISHLPVRVNQGETTQPLRLQGSGLERVETVSSKAGEIKGAIGGSDWIGAIWLKPGPKVGESFAISLKVKGLETPLTVADAIKVFGPRPVVTGVRKAVPDTLGLAIRPDELPVGITVGVSLEVRQFHDSSANATEGRPRVELGCQSDGLRKPLTLSPDDHVTGAALSMAAPGLLFLSIDPGAVAYPGCLLTAAVDAEPEGRSDAFTIGRVIRIPRLDQFTLTNEQLDPSTYVGILKGRDLDVIEKTGWDAHHGLPVSSVPTPVPGDPSTQTIRIALPWPAPAPHAPLYVWLRGEEEGRKTTVSY